MSTKINVHEALNNSSL